MKLSTLLTALASVGYVTAYAIPTDPANIQIPSHYYRAFQRHRLASLARLARPQPSPTNISWGFDSRSSLDHHPRLRSLWKTKCQDAGCVAGTMHFVNPRNPYVIFDGVRFNGGQYYTAMMRVYQDGRVDRVSEEDRRRLAQSRRQRRTLRHMVRVTEQASASTQASTSSQAPPTREHI